MNFSTIDTKTKLLLLSLLLLSLLLLIFAFLLLQTPSTQKFFVQTNEGMNNPLTTSDLRVLSISPTPNTLLSLGTSPTFSVTFTKLFRLDGIVVTITQHRIPTDETKTLKPKLTQSESGKTIQITLEDPIVPESSYTISIAQVNPKLKLFEQTYQTAPPLPTPVANNNRALIPFLPYLTNTYELSFVEKTNMYVFNFIYNPNDPTDLAVQFETAKQNALLFIKSKGIDPNTVVVDWRYH